MESYFLSSSVAFGHILFTVVAKNHLLLLDRLLSNNSDNEKNENKAPQKLGCASFRPCQDFVLHLMGFPHTP